MDREKTIKGIRKCLSHKPCSENGCPYENECAVEHLNDPLLRDALSMLKEQEAKEVIKSTNMYTGLPITHCPGCGVSIDRYLYGRQHEVQINHCPFCGQAVKWE